MILREDIKKIQSRFQSFTYNMKSPGNQSLNAHGLQMRLKYLSGENPLVFESVENHNAAEVIKIHRTAADIQWSGDNFTLVLHRDDKIKNIHFTKCTC